MYLINHTTTENAEHDYLFLTADAISRASLLQVLQARWAKSKTFSVSAYELLEFIAAREPGIRLLPCYELVIRLIISVYPNLNMVQQAYEWAMPLNRPRLVARIITTLIIRLAFPAIELGSVAVPRVPNPPLTPNQLQILCPLVDQLETALINGKYHLSDDLAPLTATTGQVVESSLRALRCYFKWDIEAAIEAIEDCAIQAPLAFDLRNDSNLILDVAAFVAVQLFGIATAPEYKHVLSHYTDRDIRRLANWTEILMKFSKLCPWPWGKFYNDWNECIFKNFLQNCHPKFSKITNK